MEVFQNPVEHTLLFLHSKRVVDMSRQLFYTIEMVNVESMWLYSTRRELQRHQLLFSRLRGKVSHNLTKGWHDASMTRASQTLLLLDRYIDFCIDFDNEWSSRQDVDYYLPWIKNIRDYI